MSDDSDSSFSDGDYYDVDISTYYNETEVFSDDELQNDEQEECFAIKSDIQETCSTTIEGFQCMEPNDEKSSEGLSNVMYEVDADSVILKDDLLDSNNDGATLPNRKSDLLVENTTSAYESGEMTDENTTITYDGDRMTDENATITYDSNEMTDENKPSTSKFDAKTKQEEETCLNMKFTYKTLNKLRRLLIDEANTNGDQEFYIGDLLNAIESQLMNLPKEKKKGNILIKPKKPKQRKLKVLSRYAIRSMGIKRDYHLRNMEIIASSISEQFIELDEMIEYFRQVNAEFNTEFNQPNTPLGEPNSASRRMDNVFMKFKVRIPALQDCYKEVKHCLGLYVKSDKTLKDDLLKNINNYFVNSRVDEVLSVQYGKILEAIRKSNRLHYRF